MPLNSLFHGVSSPTLSTLILLKFKFSDLWLVGINTLGLLSDHGNHRQSHDRREVWILLAADNAED